MSIGTLRGEPDEVHKIHLARVNALAAGLRAERAKSAELLAALVQLVACIDGTLPETGECGLDVAQAHAAVARAVIARATGGEP